MADHVIDRGGSPDGLLRVGLFKFYGEQTVTIDLVDGDTAAHLTAEQARAVARDLLEHAARLEPDTAARFLTDGYLARIAAEYVELTRARRHPAVVIAERRGTPVRTVHRWIAEARKRGLLAPTTRGRVSDA